MRRSSFQSVDVSMSREIYSQYEDVKVVADNIEDVVKVADGVDDRTFTAAVAVTTEPFKSEVTTVAGAATEVSTVSGISADVVTVSGLQTEIQSLVADKVALDSLYADKATLDSLYADKATLDSLFADKATLDSLVADKSVLDSLYADKAVLDSLYADKSVLDTVHSKLAEIEVVSADIDSVITVSDNMLAVNRYSDTYYPPSATAPTTKPSGGARVKGDMYFNTTEGKLKVFDGTIWDNAGSTVNGTSKRAVIVATEGQTVFSVAGGYDPGYADVYLNGRKLLNGTDVYVSSGTDVVLSSGAAAGDVIDIVAYGAFVLADFYSKAEIDSKNNTKVSKTGDETIAGVKTFSSFPVTPSSEPIGSYDVVNKKYVDDSVGESIPSGVITMWSGLISAVPSGWFLCNGANGTPDLRNRFVYGASVDGDVSAVGGSTTTSEAGSHTHSIPISGWSYSTSNAAGYLLTGRKSGVMHAEYARASATQNVAGSGAHTHTTLPPYMKLAYIMKG